MAGRRYTKPDIHDHVDGFGDVTCNTACKWANSRIPNPAIPAGNKTDNALQSPHYVPKFSNVNEDGETYETHDNLHDAMQTLLWYPNDHIVVTLVQKG